MLPLNIIALGLIALGVVALGIDRKPKRKAANENPDPKSDEHGTRGDGGRAGRKQPTRRPKSDGSRRVGPPLKEADEDGLVYKDVGVGDGNGAGDDSGGKSDPAPSANPDPPVGDADGNAEAESGVSEEHQESPGGKPAKGQGKPKAKA